jgi:predicted CxxxxCH...CXXCH cytochrome family protein
MVNAAGDGFDTPGQHIDGVSAGADNCVDCHSSAGGPTPGTTADANHAKHVQTAYVGLLSTNDYGNYSTNNWYAYSNTGGTPDMGCGYCHPQSDTAHNDGTIDVNLLPTDTGAAGTLKALNDAAAAGSGISGSSIACDGVYCHSNGYQSSMVYATTPDWYGGTFSGDVCSSCHGNSPNSGGTAGSPAHYSDFTRSDSVTKARGHFAGVHYDNIYDGSTGLATAGNTGTSSHGSATTSTTISCNVCHSATVTTSANDQNNVCTTCHSVSTQGDMVIEASSTAHVNGLPDVAFNSGAMRSKAQLRDASIPAEWDRGVSGVPYKTDGAFDEAVNALNTDDYTDQTCTVACHNDQPIQWNDAISCTSCHKGL